MEDEISPLQLGFDIGAVIAQTSHWKDVENFRERARSILISLDVDCSIVYDPLFIFGCGQGCGYRRKHPKDDRIEGNPES